MIKISQTLIFVIVIYLLFPRAVFAQTFQPNVRVDDTGDNLIEQYDPAIVVDDDGNIYVVWTDERNGHPDIYFARSNNKGITFTANTQVNEPGASASQPAITIDGAGNILVVWQDERNGNPDIYFAKSTDGGANFGANVRVDDTGAGTNTQSAPVIGVHKDSNSIYVVWTDQRDNDTKHIYLAKSNGGTSFGTNLRIDDADSISPDSPALVVDEDDYSYVTWVDRRNGVPEIYFDISFDGGTNFGTDVRVNDDGNISSEHPSLAVDATGNIYVAWQDKRNGNPDIYFAISTDSGESFGTNIRVGDSGSTTTTQSAPRLTHQAGHIYLIWEDDRNGNWDIYMVHSQGMGIPEWWLRGNIRVDDTGTNLSDQIKPALAIDADGEIYAVWTDNRRGSTDTDIYFAGTYQASTEQTPADEKPITGSSGQGSSSDWQCFMATAAYGTPLASEVISLKEFRDKWLLTNVLGQGIINVYYKLSPPMAEVIRQNESLRGIVRVGLVPFVGLARLMVNTTLIEKLMVMGVGMLLACVLARKRYL